MPRVLIIPAQMKHYRIPLFTPVCSRFCGEE